MSSLGGPTLKKLGNTVSYLLFQLSKSFSRLKFFWPGGTFFTSFFSSLARRGGSFIDLGFLLSREEEWNSTFLHLLWCHCGWRSIKLKIFLWVHGRESPRLKLLYSGDLNNGLVWYSNGWKQSDRWMVRYLGHELNNGLLVHYSNHCLYNELLTLIWITDCNQAVGCLLF